VTMKGTDAQTVYADLRGQILSGALPPGTPLREIALAERFGVSRTPVRGA
jgi:DNA-binding GntR family transcriptional regulator